jgi:hypothetical protein
MGDSHCIRGNTPLGSYCHCGHCDPPELTKIALLGQPLPPLRTKPSVGTMPPLKVWAWLPVGELPSLEGMIPSGEWLTLPPSHEAGDGPRTESGEDCDDASSVTSAQ